MEALSALLKRFLELEALQQNLAPEEEDEDCDEDDDEFEQLGMEGDDESSDSSSHHEQPLSDHWSYVSDTVCTPIDPY